MDYVIVSDIFGLTPALTRFKMGVSSNSMLIDPYNGKLQVIESEANHYEKFIKHCDHDKYTEKVKECFNALKSPTTCIAFSAGASAAWRAQLLTGNPHLKKLIGFYPSQLRNHLQLNAKVPCEFIFPNHEVHFNVDDVIANLGRKELVECKKVEYLHGFMNKYSVNFNANAYYYFCNYLKNNAIAD